MLEMMEKYTNHLERRVRERTEQLQGEKEKVESLLYTLLPKYESYFCEFFMFMVIHVDVYRAYVD